MDFNEVLGRYQSADPNELMEALKKVEQVSIDAGIEAQKASDAYFTNARAKKEKIEARIAVLTKQHDKLQSKTDALRKPLTAATVSGDTKKLNSIRDDMKALEIEKAQLSTEIDILEGAYITGDEELYNDVAEKYEHFCHLRGAYQDARRLVHEFAREREESYKKIRGKTDGSYGGGFGPNMEKINNHYNAENIAKLNARFAEEEAARKAAEAAKPRNLFAGPYIFGRGD